MKTNNDITPHPDISDPDLTLPLRLPLPILTFLLWVDWNKYFPTFLIPKSEKEMRTIEAHCGVFFHQYGLIGKF